MNRASLFSVACLLVFLAPVMKANDEAIEAATEAAEAWLAFVDEKDYGASWDEAAGFFRDAVPKEAWIRQIAGARRPMGQWQNRKVAKATYATSLPGAPDGEYVVIEFETSFAQKAGAIETVTSKKDPDGTCRVAGYYIR